MRLYFQMDNDTVKIGIAFDVEERKNSIQNSSGAEVLKFCRTDYIDSTDAHKIEIACHKTFKAQRIKGEFFRITFEEARAELEKYAPIV